MKTNNIYRDLRLIRSARKIYRVSKVMSVFSVIIAAGYIGVDLISMVKNRA